MAGPGGKQLGRVSVKVVPDTDGFGPELKRQLESKKDPDLKVDVEPDLKGFQEAVAAAAKAAERNKVRLDVDVDRVRDNLDRALNQGGPNRRSIDLDARIDEDRLRNDLGRLLRESSSRQKIKVAFDVDKSDKMFEDIQKAWAKTDFGPVVQQRMRDAFRDSAFAEPIINNVRRAFARSDFSPLAERARLAMKDAGATMMTDFQRNFARMNLDREFGDGMEDFGRKLQRAYDKFEPTADVMARIRDIEAGHVASVRQETERTAPLSERISGAWDNVRTRIADSSSRLSMFGRQTAALNKALFQGERNRANIQFDADTGAVEAKIEALKRRLETLKERVDLDIELKRQNLDADIARVRSELERLSAMEANPEVDLQIAQGMTQLRIFLNELEQLDHKRATAIADIEGRGKAELAALIAELEAFGKMHRTAIADIDTRQGRISLRQFTAESVKSFSRIGSGFGRAFSRVPILGRLFRGMADSFGNLTQLADGFANGTVSGFRLLGGVLSSVLGSVLAIGAALLAIGAIAFIVAVAGAAITAAWGILSGVVASIGPAIALIGAPVLAVIAGMDGIKKAAERLDKPIENLQKKTSAVFEKGLKPVFEDLATKLFPKVESGFVAIASQLSAAAVDVTKFVTSSQMLGKLEGTFFNVASAVTKITPGINGVVSAILQLTSQTWAFDPLIATINTFGQAWDTNVTKLLANGDLQAAFAGLTTIMQSLTQGLSDLVTNGISLLAGAAPGITTFLDGLTEFFNKFDWVSLGQSVGNVFSGLGEALAGVDTATIDAIEQSFSELGETFKSAEFQQDIRDMVSGIPAAIDAVKNLAKSFADIGAEVGKAMKAISEFTTKVGSELTSIETQIEDAFGIGGGSPVGDFLDRLENFVEKGEWKTVAELGMEDGGKSLGVKLDSGLNTGLKEFLPSLEKHLGLVPPAVEAGVAPVAPAVESGLTPVATVLAEQMSKLPPAVQTTLQGLADSARISMGAMAVGIQSGMVEIGNSVTLGLAGVRTTFDGFFTNVQSAATAGWTNLGLSAQSGMTDMSNAVTLGIAGSRTAFEGFFTLLQSTATAGWTNIGLAAQAGLTDMQNQITLSLASSRTAFEGFFTNLLTAANTGLTNISTAVVNAGTTWTSTMTANMSLMQQAVTAGLALIQSSFTGGFQSIDMAVDSAMVSVTSAFTVGFANANAAVLAGMQTILTTINSQFVLIVAVVTTGMFDIQNAFTTGFQTMGTAVIAGFAVIVSAFTAGFALLISITTAGMAAIVAAFVAGWNLVIASINAFVAALNAASAAIVAAIQSMVQAITSGMQQIVAAIQAGVNAAIAALNAAVPAFENAGRMMGQGLVNGLNAMQGAVAAAAANLANAAAAAVAAAAAIRSPSRVFLKLGGYIGQGFYIGIERWHRKIRIVAFRLVKPIEQVAKNVGEIFQGTLGQDLMGDTLSDVMATQRALKGTRSIDSSHWEKYVVAEGYGRGYTRDLIEALMGCEFKFDRDGVARIVNNSNVRRKRRR